MAIYNNREVSVLGPNNMANSPETINVEHLNGSKENVAVSSVYFTKEERDALVKRHPGKYDSVKIVSPDDVEAVRAGVAPSYDPSYKEAAEAKVRSDKQHELAQKNADAAKAEAEKQTKTPKVETNRPMSVNPQQSKTVNFNPTPKAI